MARTSKRRKAALVALSLAAPVAGASGKSSLRSPSHVAGAGPSVDAAIEEAAQKSGLRIPVLRAALAAYRSAVSGGMVKRAVLTVIDYSLPSHVPRLWVFDLARAAVLAHELVAHGRSSGDDVAARFSNSVGSLESSLGAFVTQQTYEGKNGLSLRLQGLDAGVNDNALQRGIVVHGAPYVSAETIRAQGRLGRSEGCPALSSTAAPRIIEMIKDGSVLFAYHAAS